MFWTRGGRERYERLKNAANGFGNDPRAQQKVDPVEDFVEEKVNEVAGLVSDGSAKVVD